MKYQETQACMATLLGLSSPLCFMFWLIQPYGDPCAHPHSCPQTLHVVTSALCSHHVSFQKTVPILHDLLDQHQEGPLDVMISETIRKFTPCPTTKNNNTFLWVIFKIPLCRGQSYCFLTRSKSKCNCLLNLHYRNKNYRP